MRSAIFAGFFTLLLATHPAMCQVANESEHSLPQRVQELVEEKEFQEALDVVKASVSYKAGKRDARLLAARLGGWAKHYQDALNEYEKLLLDHPRDFEARLGKARVQAWRGKHEAAEEEYRTILRINENQREARLGLVDVLIWTKRYQDAELELKKLSASGLDDREVARRREQLQAAQVDEEVRKLFEVVDKGAEQKRFQAALKMIDDAPAQWQMRDDVQLKRISLLAWSGEYEKAESLILDMLESRPEDTSLLLHLSKVRGWAGRWNMALVPAEKAAKDSDASREVYLQWGLVLRKLSREDQAREVYQVGIRKFGNQDIYAAHAQSYYEQGLWLKARNAYAELLEGDALGRDARLRINDIRLFSFTTSYTYDNLPGQADWKEFNSTFYFRPLSFFHIGGAYTQYQRFGKTDNAFSLLAIGKPLISNQWVIEGEFSSNTDHDVLWKRKLRAQSSYALLPKTVPTLGASLLEYPQGRTQVYNAGIDQYLPWELVASYRVFYGIDFDNAHSLSHEFRLCWQRDEVAHLCLGYVFGEEAFEIASAGTTASNDIDVIYLRGKLWLRDDWTISLDFHQHYRDGREYRRGFTLTMGLEF